MSDSREKLIIADFLVDLYEASDFESCFSIFITCIQSLGFDGALYTSIPLELVNSTSSQPVFRHSEAYSSDFIEHYLSEGLSHNDFAIKKIMNGSMSIIDWWGEESKGYLSSEERNVIETARFGYEIVNGITIPTLSTKNEISGTSIITSEKLDHRFDLLKRNTKSLKTISMVFHDRVHQKTDFRSIFLAPNLSELNAKERQVLQFLASGLPIKSIEYKYDITPGYANNMISSICRKLNVKNANQLRYLIGFYRILEVI